MKTAASLIAFTFFLGGETDDIDRLEDLADSTGVPDVDIDDCPIEAVEVSVSRIMTVSETSER